MAAAERLLPAAFYRERFPDFWADVGGEPYAEFAVHPMDRGEIERVRDAAADAWRILARAAPVLRAMPDEALAAIGIPAGALRICRRSDPGVGEAVVARFDFVLTDAGPKVIELNAETPMFLWESYEIAGAAARALGRRRSRVAGRRHGVQHVARRLVQRGVCRPSRRRCARA